MSAGTRIDPVIMDTLAGFTEYIALIEKGSHPRPADHINVSCLCRARERARPDNLVAGRTAALDSIALQDFPTVVRNQ